MRRYPMWLSSTAQQAIHAVLCIAGTADGRPVRVDEIAAVLGCPRNYLSKTLHVLVRAGVLRSERGPKGGFRLADPPGCLTLDRIVAPFEPVEERRCLVGQPRCDDARPCAAHHRWTRLATRVDEFFATTTVASLVRANPHAAARAREMIRSTRHSNRRLPHGPVA